MHAPPASGQEWPTKHTPEPNPWLDHLSRGMWLRGHISVFALGAVILLTINLIRGSGGIWADTAIGAWAVLLVAHGILMIIARLLQELLADDEGSDIRPASEMQWSTPSSWTLPPGIRERKNGREAPASQTPTLNAEESAAAAAARDRKKKQAPTQPPEPAAPDTDTSERVSWKAATDAAWLTPRQDTKPPTQPEKKKDDGDDFTPLKFD